MAKFQQQATTNRYVVTGKVINAQYGKIQFDEPVGTRGNRHVTNRGSKGADENITYIFIVTEQGTSINVQTALPYDRETPHGLVIQSFDVSRLADVSNSINEFVDSQPKISIKNPTGLEDALQIFVGSDYEGVIFLKNIDMLDAYKAHHFFTEHKVNARVVTMDNPVLNKYASISEYFDGAEIQQQLSEEMLTNWFPGTSFFIPKEARIFLTLAKAVIQREGFVNVIAYGASGAGKTEFFQHLANFLNLECETVDCSTITSQERWFYRKDFREGETRTVKTNFAKAVERGGTLIILDEINRADPDAVNPLLPLLDNRRQTTVDADWVLKVKPPIIFAATMNVGDEYVGTQPALDAALENRFSVAVPMPTPTPENEIRVLQRKFPTMNEKVIESVVNIFVHLRAKIIEAGLNIDVTMRKSEAVCQTYVDTTIDEKHILSLRECFMLCVVNKITSNDEAKRLFIEVINSFSE